METALTIEDVVAATGGHLVEESRNGSTDGARSRSRARIEIGGVSIDSRTLQPGELFVAITGPRFDGHDFVGEAAARGAAAALVHRDVPASPVLLVRVADTTAGLADLARATRARTRAAVVAITGSVGKTTTKEMTASLLSRHGPVLKTEGNLNNQYGLPLTLLRLTPGHRFAVLELGMSAPAELRSLSRLARPDLAVITVVAPVHLEFFPSVDAIAEAKAEVLEGLGPGGLAVLNRDDERIRRIGQAHHGEVLWFGRGPAADVSAENERGTRQGMRFDLRIGGQTADVTLPLPGPHNVTNFLAAAAVVHRLGMGLPAIAEGALTLRAASHRGQILSLGAGVTLLDDCYNSNPAAVEAAVEALNLAAAGRRVAFLGDMLELGPAGRELHRRVGERVAGQLDLLIAVGPLAAAFLEGAQQAGQPAGALQAFPDAAAAAAASHRLVLPGDAVLVKGSRGVRMEQVVDALRARFGGEEC